MIWLVYFDLTVSFTDVYACGYYKLITNILLFILPNAYYVLNPASELQACFLRFLPTLDIRSLMGWNVLLRDRLWPSASHLLQWLSQLVCGLPTTFMVACSSWIGLVWVVYNDGMYSYICDLGALNFKTRTICIIYKYTTF